MDVLLAHATEPPPSFEAMGAREWVSASVEAVVLGCLAKKPEDRPASARDLMERFEKSLFESPEPTPALTPPPPDRAPRPLHPFAHDSNKVVHQMEAWMPDAVATHKLRGFVHDFGGEVVESVPGVIRVRLGEPPQSSSASWFGFRKRTPIVDMELRLERSNSAQQSLLHITVLMSSPHRKSSDANWRERCNDVYCELRSYLAGAAVVN